MTESRGGQSHDRINRRVFDLLIDRLGLLDRITRKTAFVHAPFHDQLRFHLAIDPVRHFFISRFRHFPVKAYKYVFRMHILLPVVHVFGNFRPGIEHIGTLLCHEQCIESRNEHEYYCGHQVDSRVQGCFRNPYPFLQQHFKDDRNKYRQNGHRNHTVQFDGFDPEPVDFFDSDTGRPPDNKQQDRHDQAHPLRIR